MKSLGRDSGRRKRLTCPLAVAVCAAVATAAEVSHEPAGNAYHYCESIYWPAPIVKEPGAPIRRTPSGIEVYDSVAQRLVYRDTTKGMLCRRIRLTPQQMRALRGGAPLVVEP